MKIKLFNITYLAAFFLHLSIFLLQPIFKFNQPISIEVTIFSTLDLLLSILVVILIKGKFSYFFESGKEYFQEVYNSFWIRRKGVLIFIVFVAAVQAIESFNLILSGVARQDLLKTYDRAGLIYMLLSGFFKVLVPCLFFFEAKRTIKIIATIGLILTLAITASRSELAYVILIYIVLFLFQSESRQFWKLLILVISMGILASLSTALLQGREISEGVNALKDVFGTQFIYKSYAYYLAEVSILASESFDKVFFPFFGYISEYSLRLFGGSDTPIDSEFVGSYHILGMNPFTSRPYMANVLYPWWSWFYGVFGPLGLLIKAIYSYFLLYVSIRFGFIMTTVILFIFILFGQGMAHPFLTLFHVMAFAVCLVTDILIRFDYKVSTLK